MAGAAGNITVVLSTNSTNFSAGLTEAQRQLDRFATSGKAAGHSTISSMQAASASIRMLENPLGNNIRAIERLISQSAVLSNVMKAAFPLVGAIAIGTMIAKLGSDVVDFVHKVNLVPNAIKQGFQSFQLSAMSSVDALALTNDELQNNINKLQGKPQNNLAIAIDEARIKADQLATSLENDTNKVKSLLEQNQIGALGAMLSGNAGTTSVGGSVKYGMNEIQNLGNSYATVVRSHGAASPEAQQSLKDLHAKQDYYLSWTKNQQFLRAHPQYQTGTDEDMGGDQTANLNILSGFQNLLGSQQDSEQANNRNADLTAQNKKAETDKAASAAALEARKKAAEQQLQQWESDNSDWKAAQDRSLLEDVAWWQSRLDTLNRGSANYIAVNKKVNADIIASNREQAEALAKYTTQYFEDFNKSNGLSDADNKRTGDAGKAAADYITALRTSIDLNRQNGDAVAEASLKMAVSTGQMTKLDAAQVQANIHTQQYSDLMQRLQNAKDSVAGNVGLTDLQKQAQTAQINNQMTAARGQRSVQVLDDNQATNPATSSAVVGFITALDDLAVSIRDAASQMKQITTSSLAAVNTQIVRAISGQTSDFGNAGANIFRNVGAVGLQKAEGSLLSGLGFGGKADGSKANPLYVRMADTVGTVANSAASGFASLFKSSGSTATGSNGAASTLGGLFSKLVGFLPHFATGGPISSNMLSVVGENGPELFSPGTSGNIIPNHQLSSIGSAGGDIHFHPGAIDARGATNAAQTAAMIHQAITSAAPSIVKASQSAVSEQRKRTAGPRR
jgi:hypothetical protein